MRTMYLDIEIPRVVLTRLLGKISASAYYASTSPLHLEHMPDPDLPADNWVRVRNSLCGICGSDLHQLFLDVSLKVAPAALPSLRRIYLGHEMVGRVTETGRQVSRFKTGDRVVRWGRSEDCLARGIRPLCPACARGHRLLCEHAAEPLEHMPVGGGFGDTFIVPESTLVAVPDSVTDEQAIFTEPAAIAIHAAWRRPVSRGEKVLVYGCGTIGFLTIQCIRALQPECEITAVAQFPWQADMAISSGADRTILSSEDGFTMTAEITGARLYRGMGNNRMLLGGFDAVFDIIGNADTLGNSLRWTRAGGTVVLVGVNLHPVNIDLTPVFYQEVDLVGAIGHDIVKWEGSEISTFDLALKWMQEGIIKCDSLLTHRFRLDDYRQAFAAAIDKKKSQSVKVAFDLTAQPGPSTLP